MYDCKWMLRIYNSFIQSVVMGCMLPEWKWTPFEQNTLLPSYVCPALPGFVLPVVKAAQPRQRVSACIAGLDVFACDLRACVSMDGFLCQLCVYGWMYGWTERRVS